MQVCAIMMEEYGGLPKDHPDLAERIENMRLKREDEAKNKHNDRMDELLENSSENKLMKEAEKFQSLLSDEVSPPPGSVSHHHAPCSARCCLELPSNSPPSLQRLPSPCTLQ